MESHPNDSRTHEYETPQEPTGGGMPSSSEGFSTPSPGALGADEAEQEMAALAMELGGDLMALKAEIETKLAASAAAVTEAAAVQSLDGDNIVGVGVTMPDAEDLVAGQGGGAMPGQAGLVVFTVEEVAHSQLLAEIASVAGTRALAEMPITQVPVGIPDAYPHRWRERPAPGGISVGNVQITAGTLGCLAIGNQAPRNSRLMVLSNNHVLANSNAAPLGSSIVQPGPADGGKHPADQIAILERFVRIGFGGGTVNYVDCATGWAWPDRVRRELVYLSGGARQYFRIGSAPLAPSVGMLVGKSGRTTQLTQGRITAINVTVNVNYGSFGVAHFQDQIAVRSVTASNFSAPGDSGSMIWQWATGLRPVGLLFAGGGGTTFANRITRVLSVTGGLDIRLYT
jgi:hypothetical protein